MTELAAFEALKKKSAKSFNDQKALIKKIMSGKEVLCQQCKKPLFIKLPEDLEENGIRCKKGCTDILLDFI